jgi:hypothetical protein
MFFNPRSLAKLALVSAFTWETNALVLRPITDPSQLAPHQSVKHASIEPIAGAPNFRHGQHAKRGAAPIELLPISDPGVLTHGRSLKREVPLEGCFNPHKQSTFFWGAYGKSFGDSAQSITVLTSSQLEITSMLQTLRSQLPTTMSSSSPLRTLPSA